MDIEYRKQPVKYLKRTDTNTYKKLDRAIQDLKELKGDIVKLKGTDQYRLKIYHYRILFSVDAVKNTIIIEEINTRGDAY